MSSGKVKAAQLWTKNKDELKTQLEELKAELVQLRTQKIAGGAQSKLNKMCVQPIHPGWKDSSAGVSGVECIAAPLMVVMLAK